MAKFYDISKADKVDIFVLNPIDKDELANIFEMYHKATGDTAYLRTKFDVKTKNMKSYLISVYNDEVIMEEEQCILFKVNTCTKTGLAYDIIGSEKLYTHFVRVGSDTSPYKIHKTGGK